MAERCTVRDGRFVQPCEMLAKATEDAAPKGARRGIFAWVLTNVHTHQPSRTFYGVRSGDHHPKGAAFNFCPWCGEQIDAPFAQTASVDTSVDSATGERQP